VKKFLAIFAALLLVTAVFVACKKKEEEPPGATGETGTAVAMGDAAHGMELFKDVALGKSGKSCETCHPNGGTEGMTAEGMTTKPLTGVKDRYPGKFMMIMDKDEVTLAEVVNFCIVNPLEGAPLAEDSQDMKDLLAYLNTL
jgi:cytochrome c